MTIAPFLHRHADHEILMILTHRYISFYLLFVSENSLTKIKSVGEPIIFFISKLVLALIIAVKKITIVIHMSMYHFNDLSDCF